MILRKNIDKADITTLPTVTFGGRIIVVQSSSEAEKAFRYLADQPLVGIDTETRPTFSKGHVYSVSLLQVSTADTCFLVRLNLIGMTPAVRDFLQSERTVKIGLSLKDDFARLHKKGDFTARGYIELQDYVSSLGIEAQSLQKIYALVFGQRISKSQRLSNWEADVLTDAQKAYAATDAWACLNLYNRLEELKASNQLIIEDNPTPSL